MFAVTEILPDSLGDLWSVLLVLVAFALLFLFVRVLDRI